MGLISFMEINRKAIEKQNKVQKPKEKAKESPIKVDYTKEPKKGKAKKTEKANIDIDVDVTLDL